MTSVDFAWVVCLNMLSFVAHIHVLFLPALFSRVEAIANLINYDTNATGFFGSSSGYFGSSCYPCYPCYPPHTIPHYDRESSGYLGSSGPLRDSSGPLRDTSALRDSLYACAGVGNTHCYGHRHACHAPFFGHAPFMDIPLFSRPIRMSHRPNSTEITE